MIFKSIVTVMFITMTTLGHAADSMCFSQCKKMFNTYKRCLEKKTDSKKAKCQTNFDRKQEAYMSCMGKKYYLINGKHPRMDDTYYSFFCDDERICKGKVTGGATSYPCIGFNGYTF